MFFSPKHGIKARIIIRLILTLDTKPSLPPPHPSLFPTALEPRCYK